MYEIDYKKIDGDIKEKNAGLIIEELNSAFPKESISRFFNLFLHMKVLKYSTPEILREVNDIYHRLTTDKRLPVLEKLGYIKKVNKDVYICTQKVNPAIEHFGFKLPLFADKLVGKGDVNTLGISDVIADIISLDHYLKQYFVLYPQFPKEAPYIIPDALLVEMKEEKYRLIFLEIEAQKPDWEEYINKKIHNYYDLENDIGVYKYWKAKSELLGLSCPPIKDFKFSVAIIGNMKAKNIKGFYFINDIKEILQ